MGNLASSDWYEPPTGPVALSVPDCTRSGRRHMPPDIDQEVIALSPAESPDP
jgi:hypothetical protein